jgi:hypothetical protein
MTTPITIHLTDHEIDAVRRFWATADLGPDEVAINHVQAKLYDALPEPPRPFQPGDLVDRIGKPWREGTVLAVDRHLAWIKWYLGGHTTEHLCDIRHHQEDTA